MMIPSNERPATSSVPPGFRFHPTDEELLYYYLRKKVSYEAIDLDVIREVDLNRVEPWDLKDKCNIGSGHQDEWYFFSHKDKKYPTGTRTNRATTAGFWKATGRDKAIHLSSSKRIGMRKTLVFYRGRAPHGQKTEWIMHEYRLEGDPADIQEEGWVVCRVFKKKYHRGFQPTEAAARGAGNHLDDEVDDLTLPPADYHSQRTMMARGIKQVMHHHEILQSSSVPYNSCNPAYDGHLPQLFSPEAVIPNLNITSSNSINGSNNNDLLEGSHNLLRLTPSSNGSTISSMYGGPSDWSFLDKLLGSTSHPPQQHPALGNQGKVSAAAFSYPSSCSQGGVMDGASCTAAAAQPPPHHTLFPFQFQGCSSSSADLLFKFPK